MCQIRPPACDDMTMAQSGDESGCGGCLAIFLVIMVIALIVAALISLAALVDPFSWMPTVNEIWKDCQDDGATGRDDCALANRFHGFWLHVVINLGYVVAAVVVLVVLATAVTDLREARAARFGGDAAVTRYTEARGAVARASAFGLALALLPILVALAG